MSFLPSRRTAYRRPATRRGLRILATAMLVFSVLFAGGYGWWAWDLAANGVETNAEVTGWGQNKNRLYVEFTTRDGQVVETSFVEIGKIEDHPAGSTIRVRYLPDNPDRAQPAEAPPAHPIFVFVGGVLLLVSLGLTIYAWRYAPAKPNRD